MVRLENVSRVYRMGAGEVHALRGASFAVEAGEFVSIMGSSGSGKSTLLNIIGCLHRPTSGGYSLEGIEVETLSEDQLAAIRNRKIGFVFQTFNLLPRLTALKNVEIPMIYSGIPKKERMERARAILESVGLEDRVHHKPLELSGGQQQRVAIARALVTRPSIILADEPTGNLDSVSEREIMKLFAGLNEKGITIIMVTHETDVARWSNRVIKLSDGKIISDVRSG